jgi:hypothetical protein
MIEGPGGYLFNVWKWCNDGYDSRRRKGACEVLYTRLLTIKNDSSFIPEFGSEVQNKGIIFPFLQPLPSPPF